MARFRTRAGSDDITYADFDDITPMQLTVDREIEKGSVAQAAMLLEPEADCPDLLGFGRALAAQDAPSFHGRSS